MDNSVLSQDFRVVVLGHFRGGFGKTVSRSRVAQFDIFEVKDSAGLRDSGPISCFKLFLFGAGIKYFREESFIAHRIVL
jgi:hypothetical protein